MSGVNTDEILREFGDWRNMSDVMAAGKVAVKKIYRYFDAFNDLKLVLGKCNLTFSMPHVIISQTTES